MLTSGFDDNNKLSAVISMLCQVTVVFELLTSVVSRNVCVILPIGFKMLAVIMSFIIIPNVQYYFIMIVTTFA